MPQLVLEVQSDSCLVADLFPDIDDESLEYARKNITSNQLKSRIKPIKTTLEGPLIPLEEIGMERYLIENEAFDELFS